MSAVREWIEKTTIGRAILSTTLLAAWWTMAGLLAGCASDGAYQRLAPSLARPANKSDNVTRVPRE